MANWRWYGKIWAFIGGVFITHVDIYPQSCTNLILNSSFEETGCRDSVLAATPDGMGTFVLVNDWYISNGSPDYFKNFYQTNDGCVSADIIVIPQGSSGGNFQYPQHGEAFAGFYTFLPYSFFPDLVIRENIGTQLTEPLQVGKKYKLSLYLNILNNCTYTTTVQVLLTTNVVKKPYISQTSSLENYIFINEIYRASPQFIIPHVTDTQNWVLYETFFYADSAYQYLQIGNFFDDLHSDTIRLVPQEQLWPPPGTYYAIDNVSLCEVEELPLPNVISPNGDGLNDAWVVPEPVTPMHLRIYNRWGNLVYESENYANNWSGETMQGEKVTDGTYFYILTMPHAPPKKGFIQVFGE